MANNEPLPEMLEEFNCYKCRYVGRIFMVTNCFWINHKPKVLLPDDQTPAVCRRFEALREGEKLGEVDKR